MRMTRTGRFVLAALMALAAAAPASAQTDTKTQVGGWNIEGYWEAGVRFFAERPSEKQEGKWLEYRDINQGLYLENLRLRIFRPDEKYSVEITGKDWGLKTQEFGVMAERLGVWQAGFEWDQMRHLYSTTASTLLNASGNEVFTLPRPRPRLESYNGLAGSWGDIGVRWDTARMFFKLSPTPNLDLSSEYTRIHKDGERPFGMAMASPGGMFLELVQPIEQTIHDFRVRASWVTEQWQLQFGYTMSLFVNDVAFVRADNPCNPAPVPAGVCPAVGNTGQFGTTSLPPDNQAHTFSLAGGVNLPMRTRINANFTYSLRLQDEDFLPQTSSNGRPATTPSLFLPQKSLNGNVQVALFNLTATSRPLPAPVTFTAKYRLYDLMDFSDEPTFSAFIINDQNSITNGPRRAGRYDYMRQNADLDARWQIARPVALTLGTAWERWDRNKNWEVPETDEFFAKAALDVRPNDWLMARASYVPSFRRGSGYNTNAFGENNMNEPPTAFSGAANTWLVRKFNEGDRDRHLVNLMVQLTPTDTLSFSPTATYKNDNYIASGLFHEGAANNRAMLGLQEVVNWSAGMDVNWTPSDRLSFTTGYVHESNFQKQRSRANSAESPFLDWISDNTDTVDVYHASVKAVLIPKKLDLKIAGSYSYALGRVEQWYPNCTGSTICNTTLVGASTNRAVPWPAFEDELMRIETQLQYHITRNWTAKLYHVFEAFTKYNWQTDTANPFLPNVPAVWLGNDPKNYTVHIVGATISYKFE
jgi:MtrB/PioB family decaheme-associated outer membrane protein